MSNPTAWGDISDSEPDTKPDTTTAFKLVQALVLKEKNDVPATPTVLALRKLVFDLVEPLLNLVGDLTDKVQELTETLATVSSASTTSAIYTDLSERLAIAEMDVMNNARILDDQSDLLNCLNDANNNVSRRMDEIITGVNDNSTGIAALATKIRELPMSSAIAAAPVPPPKVIHSSGNVRWESSCETLPDGTYAVESVKIKFDALYAVFKKLHLSPMDKVVAPDPTAVRVFVKEYLRLVNAIMEGHSREEKCYLMANELHVRHRMHPDLYPILGLTALMEFELPETTTITGQLVVDYLWSVGKLTSHSLVTESVLEGALRQLTFDSSNRSVALSLQTYKALFKKVMEEHNVFHIMLTQDPASLKQRSRYMEIFLSKMRSSVLTRLKADAIHDPRLLSDFVVVIPALIKYINEDNVAYDSRTPPRKEGDKRATTAIANTGDNKRATTATANPAAAPTTNKPKESRRQVPSPLTYVMPTPRLSGKEGFYFFHGCHTDAEREAFYKMAPAAREPLMKKFFDAKDAAERAAGGKK
jgi:hypothetical protein